MSRGRPGRVRLGGTAPDHEREDCARPAWLQEGGTRESNERYSGCDQAHQPEFATMIGRHAGLRTRGEIDDGGSAQCAFGR